MQFPETLLCDLPSTTPSSDKLHLTTRLSFSRSHLNLLKDGRRNGLSHSNRSLTSYVSWQRFSKRLANCMASLIQLYAHMRLDLTFLPSHRTTSYQYLLTSLRNLPPNSPHAESSAIQAISTSLKLPSVFDFDALFKIDAIIDLQGHELFSLLRVFLSGGLEDYKKWESERSASIDKYGDCPHYRGSHWGFTLIFKPPSGLDRVQLVRKIRLLTLASLGFRNIGKDVPYATLASALQIDQSEVEKWVIDGMISPFSCTHSSHQHHI